MSRLLIDVGNSRIKWSRVTRGRRTAQKACELRGDGRAAFRAVLRAAPSGLEVLAVSVAGRRVERALEAAAGAAGLKRPRFLRSSSTVAGLTNGYDDAWRLGADRWAAMIGAWHLTGARRATCVVDVGTAMTLDFVDASGRHHGGYIVPGPTLAIDALLDGTRGIRRRSQGIAPAGATAWPRSTLPAIESGACESCVAMILRSYAAARAQLRGRPALVLTGGAAAAMLPLLPAATHHVPDLVLRGLELAFGEP